MTQQRWHACAFEIEFEFGEKPVLVIQSQC